MAKQMFLRSGFTAVPVGKTKRYKTMNVKSIMAIGAATLCSAVFADITSANVVGYIDNALQDGTTLVAPTFVSIEKAGVVDLLSIMPSGEFASGQIAIDTLDYAGRTLKSYQYTVPRRGEPGWMDTDTMQMITEVGDVEFAAGEGIAVTGLDNLGVVNSGAVSTDDTTVKLQDGSTLSGNFTPVVLDILSIVPGGTFASGQIAIDTLDYAGRTLKSYQFTIPRRGEPGWMDTDSMQMITSEGEDTFAPGQGFSVTRVDGADITIPGPTL